MMGSVEGGTQIACTKIIRHEFAHVLDNGFKLRNFKTRQNLFGLTSEPYPDFYYPVKDTTKYVHHLDDWYAQAHPDEDWAESFAVWLSNPNWKKDFSNWECFPKMEYLNNVMKTLVGKKQKVKNSYVLDPINDSTQTLREYYLKKKKRFKVKTEKTNPYVVKYLKKYKRDICKKLVEKTNQNTYNIKQIYKIILSGSDEVRLTGKITRKKIIGLLTRQGVKYFRKRRIRIIM